MKNTPYKMLLLLMPMMLVCQAYSQSLKLNEQDYFERGWREYPGV